ncbi:hypothetical protein HGRIS_001695 [Hohenbuehelia grisea]|uniref:Uncharacterized protein n=1 Tax=Hohenbuehelia grisea TaxID=104357 RepID=A0ABR3JJ59_9AGAR
MEMRWAKSERDLPYVHFLSATPRIVVVTIAVLCMSWAAGSLSDASSPSESSLPPTRLCFVITSLFNKTVINLKK